MTVDAQTVLELLLDLLRLTERFKASMTPKERMEWQKINAAAAELQDNQA